MPNLLKFFFEFFFGEFFFGDLFYKMFPRNAERSVAFGEYYKVNYPACIPYGR
jgi:hypothetical protein